MKKEQQGLSAYERKGLISPGVVKKCLKPLAVLLRTGDPSSALDRLFTSQHVKDLRLIIAVGMIAVTGTMLLELAIAGWEERMMLQFPHIGFFAIALMRHLFKGDFPKFFAPLLTAFGVVFGWAFQAANARLGVVDLFACEISSICRAAVVVKMMREYVERASHPPDQSGAGAQVLQSNPPENYFPVFENNTAALQTL